MLFSTMTWPLIFGLFFASKEIYYLILFGPCQRHRFREGRVGCGGAHLPNTKMLSKNAGWGALTQRHFDPSLDPPT
jgi:hypothetical protein